MKNFSNYLKSVFYIVALGLGITALVSFLTITFCSKFLGGNIGALSTPILIAIVIEFIVAIFFAARLEKMSPGTAWICYILYSSLTGFDLSVILYSYANSTVFMAFLVTAIVFVSMAVIGHTSKVDLSRYSSLAFGALLGCIITSIINIFLANTMIDWILNYVIIIIFLFLIAYDMQRLRTYYDWGNTEDSQEKLAIYGAFQLYLDFINIFIRILEILGSNSKRRK